MHPDHQPYCNLTSRTRLIKSLNTLIGIIEGISIDSAINCTELGFLQTWLDDHLEVRGHHPFNELMPVVQNAVSDGVLAQDDKDDLIWLCERLRSDEYYGMTTADLQRLHAIVGGISADGIITEDELRGLSDWLYDHNHLRTCWPYDEIASLITGVMSDGEIDRDEHKMLMGYFSEFVAVLDDKTIVSPPISEGGTIVGLCAICPNICIKDSRFCFTGASSRFTRAQLTEMVSRFGGEVVSSVSAKVNYLVIGADGNPCWAYACYGRKVEKAVELRKSGIRLLIIHENDLHDAIADCE